MNISSYTSASTLPSKVISNSTIISDVFNNKIKPIHMQLNPTNKCPFNCSFCSCKHRNKTLELTQEQYINIINTFSLLGTKACTITGGGDPLAYKNINELISCLKSKNIDIGLVTNGILLKNLSKESIEAITWLRISMSNESTLDLDTVQKVVNLSKNKHPDWAFSFVVSSYDVSNLLLETIIFANKNNFTHLRLVDDILSEKSYTEINKQLIENETIVDSSRIIYQGRKESTIGTKRCLISLLKPNIGPDGNIYPCCGIQYAKIPQSLDFTKEDSMGNNYKQIWDNQENFDGSKCIKCYYSDYNNCLNLIQSRPDHENFV